MKCLKCNAEIPDSSKFCPQCAEPQSTAMIAPPPRAVESGAGMGAIKMFLIGLAVAGIAFLVWNVVPGFRYAAPHHNLSPIDVWAVPTNPVIPYYPAKMTRTQIRIGALVRTACAMLKTRRARSNERLPLLQSRLLLNHIQSQ